jgi:hypothetical protein
LRRQGVEQRPKPERNRWYKVNAHVFDSIDNELAAYWLGFIYADGNVSRRTLKVCLSTKDRNHLISLRDFMESDSPLFDNVIRENNETSRIEFTDRWLAGRLRELGIVTWRPFPERMIAGVPPSLAHHCIRGFFDGDGSARKSESIALCGDIPTLSWIRQLAADAVGTNPNLVISKHRKSPIYYIYFSGRIQALKFADFIYRDATFWLGRKRDVVDSWPQMRSRIRTCFIDGYRKND